MLARSLLYSSRLSGFLTCKNTLGITVQAAGLQNFPPPKEYDVEVPPDSRGKKLPLWPKVPQYPPQLRPFKMQKKLRFMRGPELIHTALQHKQYGVMALMGGRLKHGHFEVIRWTCGKKLPNSAFALYRIPGPWQPITKKGHGQRMGGGKGAIDHYVTPVKSGRIIIEVGGPVEYAEVYKTLKEIADKMPFKAIPISQAILERRAEDERYIEENNENPYTFKYIIQNNLGGCHNWISPVDKHWFGKHR